MKKILIATTLIACSSLTNANEPFTGWYLGGELSSTKQTFSVPYSELDYDELNGDYTATSSRKVGIGLLGGYSFSFAGNFIGSIEGKIRTGGAKTQDYAGETVTKENFNVSAYYLQGYRINNIMPYVKIGVEASSFDINHTQMMDRVENEDSSGAWGIGYGVGVRYAFNNNLEAGIEYRRANLKSDATSAGDNKVKIKSNTIGLQINYRF